MNRTDLVRALAEGHGLGRVAAGQVVDAIIGGLQAALCEGRRVEIRGFGTWRPRRYRGYLGRNPRTGQRVEVAPKVLPVFRPSRTLLVRVGHTVHEEA